MKIIVAGGRDFDSYSLLKEKLDLYLKNIENPIIISGTCKGADKLGEKYAKENDLVLELFPANWGEYGKAAGMIRNKEMSKVADGLVAFYDGRSKGTKNMIEEAKKMNLKIRIVYYE